VAVLPPLTPWRIANDRRNPRRKLGATTMSKTAKKPKKKPAGMDGMLRSNLLKVVGVATKVMGKAPSSLAMEAIGNSRFFATLEKGARFYVDTYDNLTAFFAKHIPASKWPAGVPRPAVK
jgi:hypothetical protein